MRPPAHLPSSEPPAPSWPFTITSALPGQELGKVLLDREAPGHPIGRPEKKRASRSFEMHGRRLSCCAQLSACSRPAPDHGSVQTGTGFPTAPNPPFVLCRYFRGIRSGFPVRGGFASPSASSAPGVTPRFGSRARPLRSRSSFIGSRRNAGAAVLASASPVRSGDGLVSGARGASSLRGAGASSRTQPTASTAGRIRSATCRSG